MLLQRYLGRIRDNHVKGVVDNRASPSLGGVLVDDLSKIQPEMLRRESDNSRGTTEGGRRRRTFPVIRGLQTIRGELLDMGMRVDTTWHYQPASCVNLACARRQLDTNRNNLLAQN